MITINNRTSKWSELKPYDHFAKDDSYIEVTEWTNGEGFDVAIDSYKSTTFSLTYGEFDALVALVNYKE